MWATLFLVLFFGQVATLSYGSIGASLSKILDRTGWNTLVETTPTITAASVHILFYNGTINPNAASTIKAAWSANIRDISVYMHPCVNTSVYSVQNDVECGTAKEQFQSILDNTEENNIAFTRHISNTASTTSNTINPSARPTALPTQAPSSTVVLLSRLFVCFEDEVPNRYMSNNHGENVRFMLELQHEAVAHGVQLGIYTTRNEWLNIMTAPFDGLTKYPTDAAGLNYSTTNPFSSLPLWTARFDSINSMAFYAPFGDWPQAYMKEISGSTTALHRIGSDRVGMTFINDTIGSQYYTNQVLEYIVS